MRSGRVHSGAGGRLDDCAGRLAGICTDRDRSGCGGATATRYRRDRRNHLIDGAHAVRAACSRCLGHVLQGRSRDGFLMALIALVVALRGVARLTGNDQNRSDAIGRGGLHTQRRGAWEPSGSPVRTETKPPARSIAVRAQADGPLRIFRLSRERAPLGPPLNRPVKHDPENEETKLGE